MPVAPPITQPKHFIATHDGGRSGTALAIDAVPGDAPPDNLSEYDSSHHSLNIYGMPVAAETPSEGAISIKISGCHSASDRHGPLAGASISVRRSPPVKLGEQHLVVCSPV